MEVQEGAAMQTSSQITAPPQMPDWSIIFGKIIKDPGTVNRCMQVVAGMQQMARVETYNTINTAVSEVECRKNGKMTLMERNLNERLEAIETKTSLQSDINDTTSTTSTTIGSSSRSTYSNVPNGSARPNTKHPQFIDGRPELLRLNSTNRIAVTGKILQPILAARFAGAGIQNDMWRMQGSPDQSSNRHTITLKKTKGPYKCNSQSFQNFSDYAEAAFNAIAKDENEEWKPITVHNSRQQEANFTWNRDTSTRSKLLEKATKQAHKWLNDNHVLLSQNPELKRFPKSGSIQIYDTPLVKINVDDKGQYSNWFNDEESFPSTTEGDSTLKTAWIQYGIDKSKLETYLQDLKPSWI